MPGSAISIRPCSILTRCGTQTTYMFADRGWRTREFDDGNCDRKAKRTPRQFVAGSFVGRAADRALSEGRSGRLVGTDRQVQEPHLLDSDQARNVSGCGRHLSVRLRRPAFGVATTPRTSCIAEMADADLLSQMPSLPPRHRHARRT